MNISQTDHDARKYLRDVVVSRLETDSTSTKWVDDGDYVRLVTDRQLGQRPDGELARPIILQFSKNQIDRFATLAMPDKQTAGGELIGLVDGNLGGYDDGRCVGRGEIKEPHIIDISETWDF